MQYFQLSPLQSGFSQDYTMDEEPAVTAAAATAALHFYLSLLPDSLQYRDSVSTAGPTSPRDSQQQSAHALPVSSLFSFTPGWMSCRWTRLETYKLFQSFHVSLPSV